MGRSEDWALIEAARMGNVATMKTLLALGADVRAVDEGRTALHNAAAHGWPEAVAILVSAGADMEARTADRLETALHLAAGSRNFVNGAVGVLLDAGADSNARSKGGETPLHIASGSHESGSTDFDNGAVEALLDAGADPNASSEIGETPLHRAAQAGNAEAACALFRAGASAKPVNKWGLTPADTAKAHRWWGFAAIEAEREAAILSAETKGSSSAGKARRI